MKLPDGMYRFIKGILSVMVAGAVSYLANSANLTGILNASMSTIVAGIFLVIEGYIKDRGNGALFGLGN